MVHREGWGKPPYPGRPAAEAAFAAAAAAATTAAGVPAAAGPRPRALQAFDLYRVCVAMGQMA